MHQRVVRYAVVCELIYVRAARVLVDWYVKSYVPNVPKAFKGLHSSGLDCHTTTFDVWCTRGARAAVVIPVIAFSGAASIETLQTHVQALRIVNRVKTQGAILSIHGLVRTRRGKI